MDITIEDIDKISLWAIINEMFGLYPFNSDNPIEKTERAVAWMKLMQAIYGAIRRQLGVEHVSAKHEEQIKRLKMLGEKEKEKLGSEAMKQYGKLLEWLSQYDISEKRVFAQFEAQKWWIAREGYFQD